VIEACACRRPPRSRRSRSGSGARPAPGDSSPRAATGRQSLDLVRAPAGMPRFTSRWIRSAEERGSMLYSAVTHPRPLFRRNEGTRSSHRGGAKHFRAAHLDQGGALGVLQIVALDRQRAELGRAPSVDALRGRVTNSLDGRRWNQGRSSCGPTRRGPRGSPGSGAPRPRTGAGCRRRSSAAVPRRLRSLFTRAGGRARGGARWLRGVDERHALAQDGPDRGLERRIVGAAQDSGVDPRARSGAR